jgi:hypothetical protein
MAAMHPVKVTDCHDGAGKRPAIESLRAAARDVEPFRGRAGPAHRLAAQLQKVATGNMRISIEHLGRGYG